MRTEIACVRCLGYIVVMRMQRCPVIRPSTCLGRDVPAIIEHLTNLTDLGSGAGEVEDTLCGILANYQFYSAVYVRCCGGDRHSWFLEGTPSPRALALPCSKHINSSPVHMESQHNRVEVVKEPSCCRGGEEIDLYAYSLASRRIGEDVAVMLLH